MKSLLESMAYSLCRADRIDSSGPSIPDHAQDEKPVGVYVGSLVPTVSIETKGGGKISRVGRDRPAWAVVRVYPRNSGGGGIHRL